MVRRTHPDRLKKTEGLDLREIKGKYNIIRNIGYVIGSIIMIFTIIFFLLSLEAYYYGFSGFNLLILGLSIGGLFILIGYKNAVRRDEVKIKIINNESARDYRGEPTEPRGGSTEPRGEPKESRGESKEPAPPF